ncbi:MAG: carboxymuconolactone decarboxylase family protein [Dehalococcoidia bacterium]|nr:carboxymuconolactone decarboxylase family protein [Dehalococcoidia bacterium]
MEGRFGAILDPIAVSARQPALLDAYLGFEDGLRASRELELELKELASLKVSTMVGCAFCMDIGSHLATRRGLTERQLLELTEYRTSDAYTERQRLALEYAEAMTERRVQVSDGLFDRLRTEFDEVQLVELTAMIAWENYRGRFNHALGIGSTGLSDGAVCATPE